MIAGLQQRWTEGAQWWSARTAREHTLVALFAAGLSIALLVRAGEELVSARAEAQELASARVLEQQRRAVEATPAYAASADRLARAVRTASIGGDTIHIARVRAQSEIEALARLSGLVEVEATVQTRAAQTGEARLVEEIVVDLSAAHDPAGLSRFLQELAASEYSLVPSEVSVQRTEPARIDVQVSAFALTPWRQQ